MNLTAWPPGSRLIVRRERPHPGAQLRFTDAGGHRFTAFLTDTPGGQLAGFVNLIWPRCALFIWPRQGVVRVW